MEVIGGGLERFTFRLVVLVARTIAVMKTRCRNVRRICIYDMKNLNEKILDLLASVGDQLEYCQVEVMNEIQLTTIAGACKNVRFSATVSTLDGLCPALRVLGHQLYRIHVSFEGVIPDSASLTHAWNECLNVRDIEVLKCSIEHAKAIIAIRMENVKSLSICPISTLDGNEVKKIMDIFSEGTVGVEEFKYLGRLLSEKALNKFIARNKSSLRAVSIHFSAEIYATMDDNWCRTEFYDQMEMFLPRLLKCPDLEGVHAQITSDKMKKTLGSRGVRWAPIGAWLN